MSDLISRQAARKVILDEFEGWPTDEEVAQLKRMTKQIDELPSVEPETKYEELLLKISQLEEENKKLKQEVRTLYDEAAEAHELGVEQI